MPNLYIVSGCNGAGKTTASYTMLPELLECSQFVNSDEFAKTLSPFDPGKASIQASRLMLIRSRYLFKRREDFGIETTLATKSIRKMILKAKDAGYRVTILYFWLNSPDLAVQRVRARVEAGGHDIPEETIRRRYANGLRYFFFDYAPIADEWILADNSEIPFTIVAQKSAEEGLTIRDPEKYELIKGLAETFQRMSEENPPENSQEGNA